MLVPSPFFTKVASASQPFRYSLRTAVGFLIPYSLSSSSTLLLISPIRSSVSVTPASPALEPRFNSCKS